MKKTQKIVVKDTEITIIEKNERDFISLTDMSRSFGGNSFIENWLRNKDTIDFLGIWEQLYNPDFNFPELEGIKNQADYNLSQNERLIQLHTVAKSQMKSLMKNYSTKKLK